METAAENLSAARASSPVTMIDQLRRLRRSAAG
jgi:hypothetical protein